MSYTVVCPVCFEQYDYETKRGFERKQKEFDAEMMKFAKAANEMYAVLSAVVYLEDDDGIIHPLTRKLHTRALNACINYSKAKGAK